MIFIQPLPPAIVGPHFGRQIHHRRKLHIFFFFSSRRRHTSCLSDWSSDVCSSDLQLTRGILFAGSAVLSIEPRCDRDLFAWNRACGDMITRLERLRVVWLVIGLMGAIATADEQPDIKAPPALRTIRIEPARIELHGANRQQQVLVTGETANGRWVDVTSIAEFVSADRQVAQANNSVVAGIKDGTTRLTVRVADQIHELPVVVSGFENYPAVHFANDIVPLLSRLGCNNGGCHGKASGQNGFKLSVFGFDPVADYSALVNEARGRRVSPASPERSLVLRKASAEVPHGGGGRI